MAMEARIERHLVNLVKQSGGTAYKWVSPSNVGVPDRICVLPGNSVFFVEVKAPKGVISPIQKHVHDALRRLGARVYTVWSNDDIEKVIAIETGLTASALSTKGSDVLNDLLG